MDLGLNGKKALVTGGSTGLGFAIAEALVAEGADVILASRNPENLAKAVGKLGKNTRAVTLDFASEASIKAGVKEAGEVDILVINTGGPAAGKTLNIDLPSWDKGYQTLIRSVIQLCQETVPAMQNKKWGRILTVTSTSAKEMLPLLPVSGTFRAGLSAFAKQFAKEIGRDGILINNLLPGPTATARLDELKKKSPGLIEWFVNESAVGRLAEPSEIGKAAAFLLSAANTYITGTDVLVDGGLTRAV